MKKYLLAALLITAPSAHAGVYGESLGKCLVSASSDQDKQQLVEWIFSAISLNPRIAPYANLSTEKRNEIDKRMATLFEKLLGESCKKETAEALKYEGTEALGSAFQLLGEVAGQQIFASPEVAAGAEKFNKHIDYEALVKKIEAPSSRP